MADEIGRRIIDQTAETVSELAEATGNNRCWVGNYAREQVAAGKWEAVWKRVGTRLVPAYRRV